jgi:hypothetical protein
MIARSQKVGYFQESSGVLVADCRSGGMSKRERRWTSLRVWCSKPMGWVVGGMVVFRGLGRITDFEGKQAGRTEGGWNC